MLKKILITSFLAVVLFFPEYSQARRLAVNDWYIENFDSKIIVNKDSSLDITETITADCGFAPNKHGIFRILPTQVNVDGKKISNPVELLSIKDAVGNDYKYTTTRNFGDGTVTWQIGDAKKTLQGENVYVIHYKVKNTIRFANQKFDELYWNLNGNFWDLEIDKFHASMVFPNEVNAQNVAVDYYTGNLGAKEKNLAKYSWTASNILEFDSVGTFLQRQGITASIVFPKNIFIPYVPSFLDLYGQYLFLLLPLLVFLICFILWKKYGEDPKIEKAIIAEYAPPGNLSPIEMGMLMRGGAFKNEFITAEIIWLATRGLILIKEIESKILFFSSKDHELTKKHSMEIESSLNAGQVLILNSIFEDGDIVNLSSLKNKFYIKIANIKETTKDSLKNKGLIQTSGIGIGIVMRVISPFFIWLAFIAFNVSAALAASLIVSGVILFVFSFIMPKLTPVGAELNWQVKGFKLFMETVDKDRAVFHEKENIFEKCLPYAILFGMTKQWIKKMQEIYGADYLATNTSLWYVGGLNSFDANNFVSAIDGLSSDIAASTSSPSGASGSGGSGGGGGGGGGGGW
ncbi:MAG: DUF2207 domain-containing protein [bacterium]